MHNFVVLKQQNFVALKQQFFVAYISISKFSYEASVGKTFWGWIMIPSSIEIRSILVGRPQTLELGSNERSLRSNFVQNCSKFQQNVVQLAQNVAKFDVLGPIFVLFRGCSACATRLAAQRAEPLFLLAGAVPSRVHGLCKEIENRARSTKNPSVAALRASRVQKNWRSSLSDAT